MIFIYLLEPPQAYNYTSNLELCKLLVAQPHTQMEFEVTNLMTNDMINELLVVDSGTATIKNAMV